MEHEPPDRCRRAAPGPRCVPLQIRFPPRRSFKAAARRLTCGHPDTRSAIRSSGWKTHLGLALIRAAASGPAADAGGRAAGRRGAGDLHCGSRALRSPKLEGKATDRDTLTVSWFRPSPPSGSRRCLRVQAAHPNIEAAHRPRTNPGRPAPRPDRRSCHPLWAGGYGGGALRAASVAEGRDRRGVRAALAKGSRRFAHARRSRAADAPHAPRGTRGRTKWDARAAGLAVAGLVRSGRRPRSTARSAKALDGPVFSASQLAIRRTAVAGGGGTECPPSWWSATSRAGGTVAPVPRSASRTQNARFGCCGRARARARAGSAHLHQVAHRRSVRGPLRDIYGVRVSGFCRHLCALGAHVSSGILNGDHPLDGDSEREPIALRCGDFPEGLPCGPDRASARRSLFCATDYLWLHVPDRGGSDAPHARLRRRRVHRPPVRGQSARRVPRACAISRPETMQAIARELNLSETTFVFPPADAGVTCTVRIFTPGTELPFAGHPTIGTALVLEAVGALARAPHVRRAGDGATEVVLGEGVGAGARAADARRRRRARRAHQPAAACASAACRRREPWRGCSACRWRRSPARSCRPPATRPACPSSSFRSGTAERLARIRHRRRHLGRAPQGSETPRSRGAHARRSARGRGLDMRMFAPAVGIAEDPATGAAARRHRGPAGGAAAAAGRHDALADPPGLRHGAAPA